MKILIQILFSFIVVSSVFAGNLTIPNTFTAGTTAVAADVNDNFSAVKAEVDDNAADVLTNASNTSSNSDAIFIITNDISVINQELTSIDTSAVDVADRVTILEQSVTSLSNTVSKLTEYINTFGCQVVTKTAVFNPTTNMGVFTIGNGILQFDTDWSRASTTSIYLYNDQANVAGVASTALSNITQVTDSSSYDMSNRVRTIPEGGVAVVLNTSGNYAVLKVIDVLHAGYGDPKDELTFEYCILPAGSIDFSK